MNGKSPLGAIAHLKDISPIASEEASATEKVVYFWSELIWIGVLEVDILEFWW